MRIRLIDVLVLAGIAGFWLYKGGLSHTTTPQAEPDAFAQAVHLEPLYTTAVQADGRIRSFESHAKSYMGYISGPRSIHGQENGFTYLDLMFRPEAYADVDLIYVKNKLVREQIIKTASKIPGIDARRQARMRKTGLIARRVFSDPNVVALLERLGQDLIRTAKSVDAIQSALTVSGSDFLLNSLRVLIPPDGAVDKPWLSPAGLAQEGLPPNPHGPAVGDSSPTEQLAPALLGEINKTRTALANLKVAGDPAAYEAARAKLEALEKKAHRWWTTWTNLKTAWRGEDAKTVSASIVELASLLRNDVAPQAYPDTGRLGMESWYFRHKSMTWVWFIYLASVVPLLMSIIYKWDGARKVGMVLFVIAFLLHSASLMIRWYISGRWPNANMFEAVTTSAWFGGVAAIVLEWLTRRTAFRNLFALGSAVVSMAALMAAYFLPAEISSAISNKMAALNDVWLYIHTNMIIWSYAVIGLACVPALLLLRHRWCKAWDEGTIPKPRLILLPIALAVLNYTGYRLLMHVMEDPARELTRSGLIAVTGAFWGALLIVWLEAASAVSRHRMGASVERSASGGASSLLGSTSGGDSFLLTDKPSFGQVFDGATMVLVELAFIMLWTGTVMGAVWADHSWGRPWGWDPKEVFALNTFIIFLILIHVRLKVRDKAFWTAILAVVGFEVMLFNWIVVNFIISGLHSYA